MEGDRQVVGPLTFLFTDIEGSTRVARSLGAARWLPVLAAHHRIIGEAVVGHGGRVHRTEGDAFLALFSDARAGVGAGLEAQHALAAHEWPDGVQALRVRMGLHTGYVQRLGDDYVGLEIHLAARIGAAANGGQVLVSAATNEAVHGTVPTIDLGRHRLKDFPEPERLYHVVVGSGPPPMPRGERVRPTNLPPQLSRLIGRDEERSALAEVLVADGARIVSVAGRGGVGKTRLAVAVGHDLLERFEGGVFIVRLAGVADAVSVLPAIAEAVGIETPDLSPLKAVAQRLGERRTLVILDNFEHLLSAGELLAGLVADAQNLRILITTQAPLRIGGERTFVLDRLDEQAAAELFVERARDRLGAFRPDPPDRARIAAISRGLDCLPLAIELAAARVGLFTLEALQERLRRPLSVLTRGSRDLPERHRSLRATFEWTHGLLTPQSRRLFARLGVCAGAMPLNMIDAIADHASDGDDPVLDQLEELLEFSLVQRQEDPRYGLRFLIPQALRGFALERLAQSGEDANARRSHARYLAAVARASVRRRAPQPSEQWTQLLAVADEIRPATTWTKLHEPELHVSLCARLTGYWRDHTPLYEAIAELEGARSSGAGSPENQAWVSTNLANLYALSGAREQSFALGPEALTRLRALDEGLERAEGLCAATWAYRSIGPLSKAIEIAEEALELMRRGNDAVLVVDGLYTLVQCLLEDNQIERAGRALDEIAQLAGDDQALMLATVWADYALACGDYVRASALYAESMAEASATENRMQVLLDLRSIAICLSRAGADTAALEVHELVQLLEEDLGRPDDTDVWAKMYADAVTHARETATDAEAAAAIARVHRLTPESRVPHAIKLATPGS